METQLAERIAINAWRLRRAYRIESSLFERARTSWREGTTEQTNDIDLVFLRLSTSGGDELSKLSRYEAAIERRCEGRYRIWKKDTRTWKKERGEEYVRAINARCLVVGGTERVNRCEKFAEYERCFEYFTRRA